MANGTIQLPPDSTGKILDTEQLTVAATTVQRERIRIAGLADVDLADVSAANGLEVDVTRLPALVAGSANIGDVDVLSVIPGVGATNLGKAVNDPFADADVGVSALAVRDDALATLTPIDGDWVPLRTNNRGALWVIPDGSITVADDGSFDVNALITALPTGTNRIGAVSKDIVRPADGTTGLTVVQAVIDTATSGDQAIVAAQGAGNAILVLSLVLVVAGAVVLTWKSATTLISGDMAFAANGGYSMSSDYGILKTADNQALNLNLSASVAVSGHLTYVVV